MINCTFENGGKANLRHVTVNALVIKDNKILLDKRGTFKGKPILETDKWALLGGFFGRDEILEEAVKREVMEESGYEIENLILFRINDNPNRPKEDRQNVDIIFIAHAKDKIKEGDEEVTSLQWFDLDNTPPMDQIAFDHGEHIEFYKKYLKSKFQLPLIGKIKI
ncbi:NUDIX hydrolase [Patescibacteria group bacterium]|nr:NUDIX hydrolase [Patescibacteria group bacterium]